MDGYPGMYCDVQTYLKERSMEVLSGTSASSVLRAKANEVEKAMSSVEGVTNLKVGPQVLVPQINVRLRTEAAERFVLTAGHVRRAITTMFRGLKVGEVYEGQKRFDVLVWGEPTTRTDIAAVQALPIDTPAGVQVRCRDVADVIVVPNVRTDHLDLVEPLPVAAALSQVRPAFGGGIVGLGRGARESLVSHVGWAVNGPCTKVKSTTRGWWNWQTHRT